MNTVRNTLAGLLAATSLAAAAHAQAPLTRAQVIAEFEQAQRTGDLLAPGDSGMKRNELHPERYPKAAAAPAKTRDQVVAELKAATRSGDVLAPGDSGLRLNELHPERYAASVVTTVGKTREQVRAEMLEAIRTGDILASGDSGLKLNELYPQRYAAARAGAGAARREIAATNPALEAARLQ